MRAFHNDPAIKTKYLTRVDEHILMDRLIQGTGWNQGRGCAVGCTLEKYDHAAYETELGIPMALAHLEDALFELAPWDYAKNWPSRFLSAIQPGADLSMVVPHFIYWMLSDEKEGVTTFINQAKYPSVVKAIADVADLFRRTISGESIGSAAWSAARSAAWSAARSAARSAAESAAESAAWSAAWSAARSAAWSAARSAAWSAAWSAARSARNIRHCEKLLELLAAAPVTK